ncbi:MAG: hypothetical protein LBQ89_07610 [Treponema sp.]|jgi:hypothetical protein|nr:hypothetical protein [Treponema sp.]
MCKSIFKIAKLNLKNIKVPYLVTGITALLMLAQTIVDMLIINNNSEISVGCYLWLLPVMAAIFIPAENFRRIVNLGGKRKNFFWGSLMTYAILACIVSLANVLFNYIFDPLIEASGNFEALFLGGIANLIEVFGWPRYGPIVAFLQQFAFLFLFSVFIHTLTAAQDKWYGWTADVLIVAIIAVFTPIKPLRDAEAWFFNLILFHPNALLQIAACMFLAAGIYALNKPIFARKAI